MVMTILIAIKPQVEAVLELPLLGNLLQGLNSRENKVMKNIIK